MTELDYSKIAKYLGKSKVAYVVNIRELDKYGLDKIICQLGRKGYLNVFMINGKVGRVASSPSSYKMFSEPNFIQLCNIAGVDASKIKYQSFNLEDMEYKPDKKELKVDKPIKRKGVKIITKDLGICTAICYNSTLRKNDVDWITTHYNYLIEDRTEYEKALYSRLIWFFDDLKVQQPFVIENNIYFADFAIPSRRVIIEVDGGYHHKEEQKEKDIDRTEMFNKIKYSVFRIPNSKVYVEKRVRNMIDCIRRMKIFLK